MSLTPPPLAGEAASEAMPEGVSVAACASVTAAGPIPTLPSKRGMELRVRIVMAGLVPAIHVFGLMRT